MAPQLPRGLGVGISPQTMPDPAQAIQLLRPKWWYNWGAYWSGRAYGQNYAPMLYDAKMFDRTSYLKLANSRNALAWLHLNEPDMRGQADMAVSDAVELMRRVMAAKMTPWAGPGVCLNNRLYGWAWVDEYVRLGGPIPNAWAIHLYDVPTPAAFDEKLGRFYNWMYSRWLTRPVIVTETNGGDRSYDAEIVLLRHIAKRLREDDRLQAVAWFSANYQYKGRDLKSDLIRDGRLTAVGKVFRELQG